MTLPEFHKETLQPTIDTDAYTDGDVVGGLQTIDMTRYAGGGAILNRVFIKDQAKQDAVLRLFIYDSLPSTIADDAAHTLADADLVKLAGIVDSGTYVAAPSNTGSFAPTDDLNDLYVINTSGKLYVYIVLNGSTPTYAAADDLTIDLYFTR